MRLHRLFFSTLPVLFAAGCVSSHRPETASYSSPPATELSPSSNGYQEQVYHPGIDSWSSNAASAQDLTVGNEIRETLLQDKKLAPPPSNLVIVVHDGVVTMRGTVPNRKEQQKIYDRLAQLPGVARVQDQVRVP